MLGARFAILGIAMPRRIVQHQLKHGGAPVAGSQVTALSQAPSTGGKAPMPARAGRKTEDVSCFLSTGARLRLRLQPKADFVNGMGAAVMDYDVSSWRVHVLTQTQRHLAVCNEHVLACGWVTANPFRPVLLLT